MSLKLHPKAGVGKNVKVDIFANTMFFDTPALGCKFIEIFLTTLEI